MSFRTALTAILAFFLMAVPCMSASCAVACDLASFHIPHAAVTACSMHGMTASPRPVAAPHGHGCVKLCDQQQALANVCGQAHDLAANIAVLSTRYILPPPPLTVTALTAELSYALRSGSPPSLSSLRV